MILDASKAQLLVVDVQERLLPAMAEPELVVNGCAKLVTAAKRLAVPVLVSEQYPKGLGPTVAALKDSGDVLAKLAFSCAGDTAIVDAITTRNRPQIVICGIEAHVCVLQSALGFKAKGYDVAVVWDAVSSRKLADKGLAAHRMRGEGIAIVNVEMTIFEWLGAAGTPQFKELSTLIK
jgi:nicotinamidase-related amidase